MLAILAALVVSQAQGNSVVWVDANGSVVGPKLTMQGVDFYFDQDGLIWGFIPENGALYAAGQFYSRKFFAAADCSGQAYYPYYVPMLQVSLGPDWPPTGYWYRPLSAVASRAAGVRPARPTIRVAIPPGAPMKQLDKSSS